MNNRHPDTSAAPGRSVRDLAAGLPLLAALFLPSCSNPLAPIDADYDRRLAAAPERLRSIQRFDGDRYAQPAPDPDARPDPATRPPSRLEGRGSVTISIEEARAAALRNNLDIKVALVDPAIAAERLKEEEAKFEAIFTPRVAYQENDSPALDVTAANQQDSWQGAAGVSIPLRTGGRASIDYTQGLSETDNPFFTLNTSYTSDLGLSLTQPLLRGAGRRVNTHSIRIAEYNRQIGETATKLEVMRQIAAVDKVYWVLDARKKELGVRQDEFNNAQEDLAKAKRRVAAGAGREIDVINAESAAAAKLEAIITAENAVLRQQRELKKLMNLPDLPQESPTLVEPATRPEAIPYAFNTAELVRRALTDRMEMLELELRLASDYSNIEFAKNQALPSFVLDYRYSINGLGPTMNDSVEQLRGNDFESWSVSVRGEIPIGNEAAKARVKQAILARLQRLSSRHAREQSITQEVLQAVDNIEATWQRILAARQRVFTDARSYEAEQRRWDAGRGDNIDLLNANARLADARATLVVAIGQYQIDQVDLAFVTGTLLGAGKIDWSPLDESNDPAADPTPPAFPLYADPEKASVVPREGRPKEQGMGH